MRRHGRDRDSPRRDRPRQPEEPWTPKTDLGRRVLAGEVTSMEEVMRSGRKILETQIVDRLLPGLTEEVMDVSSTQRMTAYGRKMRMRASIILGNRHGYIALGIGKAPETRDAIKEAMTDAKKRMVRVQLGCGSWECGCGQEHSIKQKAVGKSASTQITILPAPRGVGIVAGETTKKVLELAGVQDCWSFSKGRTRNVLNTVQAAINALDSLNKLKKGKTFSEEMPDSSIAQGKPAGEENPVEASQEGAQPETEQKAELQ